MNIIPHDSLGALPVPTIHDEAMAAYQHGRHSLSPDRVHVSTLVERLTSSPSTAVTRVMPAVSSEPLAVLA